MANYGTDKALMRTTKEYSEFSRACKEMARQRRERSPVQIEKNIDVLQRISDYIEDRRETGKPLTHAGFMRCFGICADTYYKLDAYDYVLDEYRLMHGLPPDATEHETENGTIPLVSWADIKKNVCDVAIQEQLEENCYNVKARNSAGSIFGLKARYDWRDDNTTPQTVNNTLVIADGQQARKALEMLQSK